MARILVGIGGWTFAPWRGGAFYPKGLPQARELDYASRHVTSIEVNGTFYGAQKPASFRKWRGETPDDFVFSLKGPRFATHRRDLAESKSSLDRFIDSGIGELGDKLGPLLWQFPAFTKFDEANFAAFVELLPKAIDGRRLRHVLEVRHPTFADARFTALLDRHGVALAQIDAETQPALPETSGDFVYARLKSAAEDVPTGYTDAALDDWLKRFRAFAEDEKPRDCFVYFINGAKIRAPAGAMAFLEKLSR
jgi:uncharacterized protein YecE (DUF72 family)